MARTTQEVYHLNGFRSTERDILGFFLAVAGFILCTFSGLCSRTGQSYGNLLRPAEVENAFSENSQQQGEKGQLVRKLPTSKQKAAAVVTFC